MIRIVISVIVILGGYFWTYGALQIGLYVFGVVMGITGATRFCPLYMFLGIRTQSSESENISVLKKTLFVLILIGATFAGSYYSIFFTNKIFIEDYNQMNNYYKQTLFNTGQNKRDESVANYDTLIAEYAIFSEKYSAYHPDMLKSDGRINEDFKTVSNILVELRDVVYSGDLGEAHTSLEAVRPIFQDILKRNGFSMLAVVLVDFHDVMEKVLDAANSGNSEQLLVAYLEADRKLVEVEQIENDAEIQTIRLKLEEIRVLAENDQTELLSAKATELKSAFVKVYLKRG